jgi:hypothetical protein
MGGAIDAHASAMASLHVIEPMHDHCDKHHVDMTQMMDEMRVTMPDGAMGGGMM